MFRQKTTKTRVLKKGIDGDESRRKREENSIELRKKGREEQVQKRRAKAEADSADKIQGSSGPPPQTSLIPEYAAGCASPDPARQAAAAVAIRKLLSIQDSPPIQAVIDHGAVPKLVQLLRSPDPTTVFEAAWALTNIASGTKEQTKCVIDSGAIPLFAGLLASTNKEVKEQAVWALGNIAGDSAGFRDEVLRAGALPRLMQCCAPTGPNGQYSSMTMLRNAVWALSNLCRGKPQPHFDAIKPLIPCLSYLLNLPDEEVLADACWALSYVTDDNTTENKKIQACLDHNVGTRLARLLGNSSQKIQTPALRAVGNIVTGTDKQTGDMIACGILPHFQGLLQSSKRPLRKEACWTISNITAGTPEQVEAVCNAGLVPILLRILDKDDFFVKKEAAWAVSNITNNGTKKHLRGLAQVGALQTFCRLLDCNDPKIVIVALEAIENILRVGQEDAAKEGKDNPYCDFVEEANGLDKLETLQRHDNTTIYDKSVKIIQTFFREDDDAMGEETGSSFSFGAPAASSGFFGGAPGGPSGSNFFF